MKILITGNMGYVGSVVVGHLRATLPNSKLIGFDIGYFAHCLTGALYTPETLLNEQHFGDVRHFPTELLRGVDAIVHLAAISNDPIGNTFESTTKDVNYHATVKLARDAKSLGVRSFVFASSCSVYGFSEKDAMTEDDPLGPLTVYSKSKVNAERGLSLLAGPQFTVTCLRFATACGMSPRLRLDLVLNDFVASAVAYNTITILSDGSPWRPLIHVNDMALAIEWALKRTYKLGGDFLAINTGSNDWNYQVKTLATAVKNVFPNVHISMIDIAVADKRSYRVDFSLFYSLAPYNQPRVDLMRTIRSLCVGLESISFRDQDFRKSNLMRLNTLKMLQEKGFIDQNLEWSI